ncbi:MAG: hypothetical protein GX621_04480, partial [Pirellulaceae bacterium]|nr:hypothetical protein [Pirellulaceae bacterium]
MTTERQSIANRQNALQSTGPRTPEGKAVSRMNALRHGLRSEAVILPDEDVDEYEAFDAALRSELAPAGELESILVDRIVGLA